MKQGKAGDWNKRGKASRQMLNGACKYRERRDTKGAPKRSGVRADQAGRQAGRKGDVRRKGGDVRGRRFIVCRARTARALYPPGKEGPERGRG